MKEAAPMSRSRLGLHTIFAGFNVALIASCNPALAHGGGQTGHLSFSAPVNSQASWSGGISPHFGGTAGQGLIHPHNAFSPLASSVPLAPFAPRIAPFPIVTGPETVQLNLSSNAKSVVVDSAVIADGSSVTILLDGKQATIHSGQSVTPAELVAIYQIQAGGGQTIVLDRQGRADGGTFSLNSLLAAGGPIQISSIVVPQKVSAIDYLSANTNLSLSGDLLNYGSIIDVSKGSQNISANLSALDIVNESGGLITTTGHGAGAGTIDLGLNAAKDFTNQGTISSSGALSITAGGNLSNGVTAGGAGAKSGNVPTITATNDLSLQSTNISNSGLLASSSGNINLGTVGAQNMNVNNTGGTLSALGGAINVREAGYSGGGNTNIAGGNLLSQQLNLNAGAGTINVNVDQLTGTVNSVGSSVHVEASTQNLVLGSQNLTGDPTFYNPGGDITITGDVVVHEDLAIIASGNITATSGLTQINTVDGTGQGHNIFLVAGANVTGAVNDSTTTVPGTQATASVSFSGASATGGDINLSAASGALTISSASTTLNFNAANITMAAFSAGGSGGHILLPGGSNIDASANTNGTGTYGNVSLLAGATSSGTAISIGSIFSAANFAGGNNIRIMNVQPIVTDGPISFAINGVASGGQVVPQLTVVGAGDIVINGTVSGTGPLQIIAGGSFTVASSSGGLVGEQPALGGQAAMTLTAGKNITLNTSVVTVAGAMVLVAGGNVTTGIGGLEINSAAQPGINGQNLTIVSGATFSYDNPGDIIVSGASGQGGGIDFSAGGGLAQLASAGTSGAAGGNILLVSFGTGSGGLINLGATPTVTTGGSTGSANGSFTAIGNFISTNGVNVTGGASGKGDILLSYTAPNTAAGNVTISPAGAVISGSFSGGPIIGPSAGNSFGPLTIAGGNLTLLQGLSLTVSSSIATGSANAVSLQTLGSLTLNAALVSGSVNSMSLQSGGDMTIFAPVIATGSLSSLTVQCAGNFTLNPSITVTGTLDIAAGGNANLGTTNLNANNEIVTAGLGISLGGNAQAPGGVIFVAGGSITTTNKTVTFFTKSSVVGVNSGNIVLVAGAAFTEDAVANTVSITGPSGATSSNLFASGGFNPSAIDTLGNGSAGGNITLAAFGSTTTGQIFLGNATVESGGSASFNNGNITLVSGFQGFAGINNTTLINLTGGNAGTGNLTVSYTAPNASAANPVVINKADGSISQGDFLGGAIATGSGGLLGAVPKLNGGNFTFVQALPMTINSPTFATGAIGTLTIESGSDITLQSSVTANAVALLAGGNITLSQNATLQQPGGLTLVAGHNITSDATATAFGIDTSNAGGNGGAMTIVAGAAFNLASGGVTVTGASSTGGVIDFSQGLCTVFTSQGLATNSNGGNMTLVAFAGSDGTGSITLNGQAVAVTAGSSSGLANPQTNGNFTAVAGQLSGLAISSGPGVDTTTSNAGLGPSNVSTTTGIIQLQSATPNVSTGSPLIIATNGVVSGNPINTGTEGTAADIAVGSLVSNAGSVIVQSSRNVVIGSIDVSAPLSSGVNGGSVTVTANGTSQLIVGSGASNTVGSINASADTATLGLFRGNIDINNLDPNNVGNGGIQWTLGSITNTGEGAGTLSLTAGKAAGDVINLTSNTTIDYSGQSSEGGGSISLIGNSVTWTGIGTPLILKANQGSGATGPSSITYETAALTPLNLDGSTLQFSANGGSGNVSVENGGGITYNPSSKAIDLSAGVNTNAAAGGNLTLQAGFFQQVPIGPGNSSLLVTGPLSENATGSGSGGAVNLFCNTVVPFNLGSTTGNTNGVMGALSVTGAGGGSNGFIAAINSNGGVITSVPLTAVKEVLLLGGGAAGGLTIGAALGGSATSFVTLSYSGAGNIVETGSKTIVTAGNLQIQNSILPDGTQPVGSGNVGGKTAFAVDAATVLVGNGTPLGGSVNITDSASAVTFGNPNTFAVANGNVTFSAPSGVLTVQNVNSNGAINLSGTSVIINNNILASTSTGAVQVTATTGNITCAGSDISAVGSVNLSALKGQITVDDIGNVQIPSSVLITALNGITVNDTVAGNYSTILKTTSGMGTIQTGNAVTSEFGSLSITSAAGNITSTNPSGSLNASTSLTLSASKGSITAGSVFCGGSTGTLSIQAQGAVTLSSSGELLGGKSISVKAGGTVSLGSFVFTQFNKGSISITSTGGNVTGNSAGDMFSTGGGLTLSAAKGLISVGALGDPAQSNPAPGVPSFISLTALSSITTGGSIFAANTITAKTTISSSKPADGIISIGGDTATTSATGGVVTLTSSGIGTGVNEALSVSGTVSGSKSVTLTAAKGGVSVGEIGSLSSPSSTVTVSAQDNILVGAGGITAANAVTLKATGTTAGNGDISVAGNIVALVANTGVVTLTASGPDVSAINSTGDISGGKSVTLTAAKGGISLNQAGAAVATPTVTVSALSDLKDSGLISATSSVKLTTTGTTAGTGITIGGGIATTAGAISVITAGAPQAAVGGLTISSGAQITANSPTAKTKATILLEDSNTNTGAITIGAATIATSGAGGNDITVTIGAAKLVPGTNPNPNSNPLLGILVNGNPSQVFFGTANALNPTSVGTITVQNADMVFSSSSKVAQQILFSGAIFNPDPPLAAASSPGAGSALQVVNGGMNAVSAQASPASVANGSPAGGGFSANSIAPASIQSLPQSLNAGTQQLNQVSLGALTTLGATTQQTRNLQGAAEMDAPSSGWISATEFDGGEIPVAVLSEIALGLPGAGTLDQTQLNVDKTNDSGTKIVTLARGSVLSVPTVDTIIKTPFGDVSVAAKSLALIMAFEHGVAVYNLHDRHADAVVMNAGGKLVSIRPGSSAVVVSQSVKSFDQVNPAQLICYRRMSEHQLDGGLKVYKAEFSLPSAMEAVRPLKSMILSKHRETSRVANNFLKTTAILMQLQAGGEDFRQIMVPQMTAYRQ